MPTSIPFDPALVLGEILPPARMIALQDLDKAMRPMRQAQDALNALILLRRSLDMTIQELINLQVEAEEVKKVTDERTKINTQIAAAAVTVATASTASIEERKTAQGERRRDSL